MSIALHELTHYHCLTSPCGLVFACRGFLSGALIRALQGDVAQGRIDENLLGIFLRLHASYVHMLEAWRPLLEGIAMYVQLCDLHRPRTNSPMPFQSLLDFGVSRYSLMPGQQGVLLMNQLTSGMETAIAKATEAGPCFILSGRTLAATLECGA